MSKNWTQGCGFTHLLQSGGSIEQGTNCDAFMLCQGKAFVVGSVGAENRKSMGMRLNVTVRVGCWASLMCMYFLFSFVPCIFLLAWVFFKAHTEPCPGTALALGKQKIREPPV